MFWLFSTNWRMGGMAVACKIVISPSILTCGWHGGSDVLIGPSISAYGWHGARAEEWYKCIHFGVWGGMEIVMV
jgi:hypothetical protein